MSQQRKAQELIDCLLSSTRRLKNKHQLFHEIRKEGIGINKKGSERPLNENYKSLKKEIKEDIRKWNYLSYLWISRMNILKSNLYVQCNPHQNCNYNSSLFLCLFLMCREKATLKFIWKHKRLQIYKARLSKKNNAWKYHNADFKLYYNSAIAIKIIK
jgi:hypothetical protein